MTHLIQFLIAVVIGCLAFYGLWIPNDTNPKVPLIGGFIAGVFGQWLVMKAYVLLRYGWAASKSMKLYGND